MFCSRTTSAVAFVVRSILFLLLVAVGRAEADNWTIIQLSNDHHADMQTCDISGPNAVWDGWDGNDVEIFLYDGSTVTQLTDNNYRERQWFQLLSSKELYVEHGHIHYHHKQEQRIAYHIGCHD